MKKLWIALAMLLMLCGCSANGQTAGPASDQAQSEQKQTEPSVSSVTQREQESAEAEEAADLPKKADAKTAAEEPAAQEEPADRLSEKSGQEDETESQDAEEAPLPAKPKLADFPNAAAPDDTFICMLNDFWNDDTPAQWRVYTKSEETKRAGTQHAGGSFAAAQWVTEGGLYDLSNTLEESDTAYQNGAFAESIGAYRTQILVSGEFDLDGCGADETIQILRLQGSDGFATGVRVIKNGECFDLTQGIMPYFEPVNIWIADLDADGSAEVYLRMENGTVQQAMLALEFSASGIQRLEFKEEESLKIRRISITGDTLLVVATTRVSGAHIAIRRYCKNGQQIIPIDQEWTYVYRNGDDNSILGEAAVLRVKNAIPAVLDDGTQLLLAPDTCLIFLSGDEKSYVRFLTDKGQRGTIAFTEGTYGAAYIGDQWIDEYFDFFPRAE